MVAAIPTRVAAKMEPFHPQRRRACRYGSWRAGTVFHVRPAIATASSHRSALHRRSECLRHSPVAQFGQFRLIVHFGSVHGHPFQSADFFRFAPAKLFDSYRRSSVTRPRSGAADHRGDLENIVRFVTANGGGGAEDRILARDTLIVDRLRTPAAGSIVPATIETLATSRPPPEPSVTDS